MRRAARRAAAHGRAFAGIRPGCLAYLTVVTAEEHSIIGGLGSAVAEVLAENAAGVPFERVGIKDRFGQSGKPPMLFEEYGLTDKAICEAVRRVLAAK